MPQYLTMKVPNIPNKGQIFEQMNQFYRILRLLMEKQNNTTQKKKKTPSLCFHTITECLRLPLPKQGHLEQATQDRVQTFSKLKLVTMESEISKDLIKSNRKYLELYLYIYISTYLAVSFQTSGPFDSIREMGC